MIQLAADVRAGYYAYQAALQTRSMLGTITEAARTSAALAQRQHASGNISALVLENIQALYEEAKLNLAESEEEVLQARERLNRLLGTWGNQTEWGVPEQLPELPPSEEPIDGLESLAVSKRLDLAATKEAARAAQSAVPL
ncbi:MAG: TolC family protein, partial [Acidobacteria bacterium]|nr:TolC family protein [Acidobacteriota bacterium]